MKMTSDEVTEGVFPPELEPKVREAIDHILDMKGRGGKRNGAGRKPSGKRRIVMYGTAAEEATLRKTLLEIRKSIPVVDNVQSMESEICHPKICPSCGSPMKIKSGSRGDFWGCSGYPKCRHTDSI